jgi:hypothetical protein
VTIRGADLKKKRTEKSVWFKYADEEGLDPHKSAWADYAEKETPSRGAKEKLPQFRFCTKCGDQLNPESRFCERCGNHIKK